MSSVSAWFEELENERNRLAREKREAEKERIMQAFLEDSDQGETDIFQTQKKMVGSLKEILTDQDRYISPPAPIQQPRNYLLWIVIGIGILIYMGKIKL